MKLEIINNKGVFEIHGDFAHRNVFIVRDYFDYLLNQYYEIVMCLKEVNRIDSLAMAVLKYINTKAQKRGKALIVYGRENEKIKNLINETKSNYIFNNDYC